MVNITGFMTSFIYLQPEIIATNQGWGQCTHVLAYSSSHFGVLCTHVLLA